MKLRDTLLPSANVTFELRFAAVRVYGGGDEVYGATHELVSIVSKTRRDLSAVAREILGTFPHAAPHVRKSNTCHIRSNLTWLGRHSVQQAREVITSA